MRPAIQRAGEFDNKPVIVIAMVAPDEATTTSLGHLNWSGCFWSGRSHLEIAVNSFGEDFYGKPVKFVIKY